MFKEKEIQEILECITKAADSLGWNSECKTGELIREVEKLMKQQFQNEEKKMRKYVEDAYREAAVIYSTGHSFLFYKRHDRQPIELKFGFDREDLYYLRENKIKYVTEEEFDIIRERLKTDTSKRLCDTRCDRFWKSFMNARRFCVPVSFDGENFDYCDKSRCEYHDEK